MMSNLLISNVVYGPYYAALFLNQHLKSMLDETNLGVNAQRCHYVIYTDKPTRELIEGHPSFRTLQETCQTEIVEFTWPTQMSQYQARYNILIQVFREVVKIALERNLLLSFMVADLVVAKNFLTKMFAKMDAGHGAVFVMPMRCAHESLKSHLDMWIDAPDEMTLFRFAYTHMNPLFIACHFKSPTFTNLPFSLIWNTGQGLLIRSYSLTPIILRPTPAMYTVTSTIDEEVPDLCENPFIATDWLEAPVVCCEFLKCFYPPFGQKPANVQSIKAWASRLHPSQRSHLKEKLFYPSKAIAQSPNRLEELESDIVVQELTKE